MNCKKCGAEMWKIGYKMGNGNERFLFNCYNCGYAQAVTDPEKAKLVALKDKLLNPKNHAHNAFVYRAIYRNKELSTIGLMAVCLDAGITNGRREARKLKEIGLLGNYKANGKKYVVWHTRELV